MKAAFSYGQEMVSVFFAIKLKDFVVILILSDKYLPFPDEDSPPPPAPRRFSTRGVFSATKIMKIVYWRGHMTTRGTC